jgi:hypothetical protein
MLDVFYPSLHSFVGDCLACGLVWCDVLDTGEYLYNDDGSVVASAYK